MYLLFVVHLKPYLNLHENSLMSSAMKSCEKSQMRIPVADGSALKGSLVGKFQCRKIMDTKGYGCGVDLEF